MLQDEKKKKKKRRLVTTNNMICCCNPAWLHSLRDQISVSTCTGMDSCYVSRVGSSIWAPRLGSLCLLDQSWLLPRQNGEWVEPPHATASMQLWQKAFKRMQHFTLLPFLTSRKQQRSLNMLWFQAGFWLYVFFSIKAYPLLPLLVIFRTSSLQQLAKTTTKKIYRKEPASRFLPPWFIPLAFMYWETIFNYAITKFTFYKTNVPVGAQD